MRLCGELADRVAGSPAPRDGACRGGRGGSSSPTSSARAGGSSAGRSWPTCSGPSALPDSWTTSLSAVVSRLRRLLAEAGLDGATALVSSAAGYQLALPDDAWIDWELAQRPSTEAETAVAAGDHVTAASAAAAVGAEIAGRGFLSDDCEWVDAPGATWCATSASGPCSPSAAAHLLAGSPARAVEAARRRRRSRSRAGGRLPAPHAGAGRRRRAGRGAAGVGAVPDRRWSRSSASTLRPRTEAVYLRDPRRGGAGPRRPPTPSCRPASSRSCSPTSSSRRRCGSATPTAMAEALERHDALVAEVVAAHGGTLLKSKLEGDATVSVFARATAAAPRRRSRCSTRSPPSRGPRAARRGCAWRCTPARPSSGAATTSARPSTGRPACARSAGPARCCCRRPSPSSSATTCPRACGSSTVGHRDLRGLSRGENVSELDHRRSGRRRRRTRPERRRLVRPSAAASGPLVGDSAVRRPRRRARAARRGLWRAGAGRCAAAVLHRRRAGRGQVAPGGRVGRSGPRRRRRRAVRPLRRGPGRAAAAVRRGVRAPRSRARRRRRLGRVRGDRRARPRRARARIDCCPAGARACAPTPTPSARPCSTPSPSC